MSKSRSGGGGRSNHRKNNEFEEPNKNDVSAAAEGILEMPDDNENALALTGNSAIPNSPPPSYEYVLEEARLGQSAMTNGTKEGNVENKGITDEMGRIYDGNRTSVRGIDPVENERPSTVKGPEILHKSSKEFYRAVAKQWGITCKMSDHCRCLDCQSHYFDCEYEKDEQEKTDGGLGAGTPMFISEVIHGTACSLL